MRSGSIIKAYLAASLLVQLATTAVAMYVVSVSQDFWANTVTGGRPFPAIFWAVEQVVYRLPLISVGVIVLGIVVVMRASERVALHVAFAILYLNIGVICLTAIGVARPLEIEAKSRLNQSAKIFINLSPSPVGNRL